MRSLSLLLAAVAFTGCAPAQTTRTTYVHEIVVVEAPRATAQTWPRGHEPRGWALGHRATPAPPRVAGSVSVVSVEQHVLIETAPRQTDNPIPTRSAFFATQRETPRSSLDEKKKTRSRADNGRTKEGSENGRLAPSTRTERAERGAKKNKAQPRLEGEAQRTEPKRKHDAVRSTGQEEAGTKRARKGDPTRRARSDGETKRNRKSEVNRETTRAQRGEKRGAKKAEDRRREARSRERARQRLARAKAQAKKRRSERKPVKKSFEAFARR